MDQKVPIFNCPHLYVSYKLWKVHRSSANFPETVFPHIGDLYIEERYIQSPSMGSTLLAEYHLFVNTYKTK